MKSNTEADKTTKILLELIAKSKKEAAKEGNPYQTIGYLVAQLDAMKNQIKYGNIWGNLKDKS